MSETRPILRQEVLANLTGHEFSVCVYSKPGIGRIDAVVRIGFTTIYAVTMEGYEEPINNHYLSSALSYWELHAPLHNVKKVTPR